MDHHAAVKREGPEGGVVGSEEAQRKSEEKEKLNTSDLKAEM